MSGNLGPPKLTFRTAVPADASHLASIINAGFRNEKTGQTWIFNDQSRRVDIVSANDTANMIAGPDTVMLTGNIPSELRPVACCFLQRPSDPAQAHMTTGAAWFGLLAVQPKYHHRGYGRAMLAEAEEFVQQNWNVKRLEMDYVNARTELRAWYGRCGYQETGAKRDFRYGDRGREIFADGLEMIVLGKDLTQATSVS
ncbi:uncharacterized protein MYCFIDRAFT_77619 [Pseudocercospora fijiensis CIRAD86]|uniref:N-acetyltransferase domain-containing protein n=1 Tax=Pseudocercospora fijiensis (strain CIRAD86) TaxID=383855 RepID=M2YWI2_PSEFD|nr:uncharacterized protein MYCFIDRAFT_77619 [Pseudocercospora fijiensis CIRAD86]EME82085.1 hypothetical protein MYCFIDRAFT_77619 [Pseudocercospora fijiensis CIRAD86]